MFQATEASIVSNDWHGISLSIVPINRSYQKFDFSHHWLFHVVFHFVKSSCRSSSHHCCGVLGCPWFRCRWEAAHSALTTQSARLREMNAALGAQLLAEKGAFQDAKLGVPRIAKGSNLAGWVLVNWVAYCSCCNKIILLCLSEFPVTAKRAQ